MTITLPYTLTHCVRTRFGLAASVMPAKAGIHLPTLNQGKYTQVKRTHLGQGMDARLRGHDACGVFFLQYQGICL
ncbi:MAG: hypothetical protein ABTQ34_06055 [Bdellovibrionales bacterium]